ncbi:MAG TPA: hypothetical protein VFL92_06950 [Sphingomonas sp.]|nr:hypothetical protein [Sphingomonas sp.]
MSSGVTTTDHDQIRKWIEERGGRPTVVKDTEDNGRGGGMLRVDFREPDESLDPIEWDEFFRIFDENDLAFLHQDKTEGGETSRFNKFVQRSHA